MMVDGSTMTHGPDYSPDKRRKVTFLNAVVMAVATEENNGSSPPLKYHCLMQAGLQAHTNWMHSQCHGGNGEGT